jgi:SP family general alpha glucoside:H+ symporter-like MFS transporter
VCSSIALKVLADNEPTNYLTAVYTEWAMLGIMGIVYLFIPESPYWCAGKGNDDRGRKIIEQLNGDIEGYDVDFHYSLVKRTVELEQEHARRVHGDNQGVKAQLVEFKELFTGVDGVG